MNRRRERQMRRSRQRSTWITDAGHAGCITSIKLSHLLCITTATSQNTESRFRVQKKNAQVLCVQCSVRRNPSYSCIACFFFFFFSPVCIELRAFLGCIILRSTIRTVVRTHGPRFMIDPISIESFFSLSLGSPRARSDSSFTEGLEHGRNQSPARVSGTGTRQ